MLSTVRSRLSAAVRAAVQQLEERTFLSVAIQDDFITVTGDTTNDQIIVQLAPGDPNTLQIIEQSSSDPTTAQVTSLPVMTLGPDFNTMVPAFNAIIVDTGTGDHLVQFNEAYGKIFLSSVIIGGDGNDTLIGGSGNTQIEGGLGDDSIMGGNGGANCTTYLNGGDGNDTIVGGTSFTKIYGGIGDDSIVGGRGNDYIQGDDGNDTIVGGYGNDYIWGGNGDDSITTGIGNDTVDGGYGNDSLTGNIGNNILMGGPGNDVIQGALIPDSYLNKNVGNDTILGGLGDDTLIGGTGPFGTCNNAFDGGGGVDSLSGGSGHNIFQLNPGDPYALVYADSSPVLDSNLNPFTGNLPAYTGNPYQVTLEDGYSLGQVSSSGYPGSPYPIQAKGVITPQVTSGIRMMSFPSVLNFKPYTDLYLLPPNHLRFMPAWWQNPTANGTSLSDVTIFPSAAPSPKLPSPSAASNPVASVTTTRHALPAKPTIATGTISGVKFNDLNGNGVRDAGEPGLPGWRLYLDLNNNGKFDAGEPTATTSANGSYSFTRLAPGNYVVRDLPSNGWVVTHAATAGRKVALSAGQVLSGNNAGSAAQGRISGYVFFDKNGNRRIDAGEASPAGLTAYLDYNNNGKLDAGEVSVKVDSTGHFTFPPLLPHVWNVRIAGANSSWYWTTPASGVYTVNLKSGQTVNSVGFGMSTHSSVRGTVFKDLNGNGKQDAGELGKAGMRVFVDSNNNGVWDLGERSVLTDSAGNYLIGGLKLGTYVIRVLLPAGRGLSIPAGGYYSASLQALKVYDFDFGVIQV